mmetsp:Transcript_43359/g.92832  ORF Transcript_43359/g.92832 Transcript_43359/m.92832 type:complete len:354 (+) Transcript_43359:155-1216(+)
MAVVVQKFGQTACRRGSIVGKALCSCRFGVVTFQRPHTSCGQLHKGPKFSGESTGKSLSTVPLLGAFASASLLSLSFSSGEQGPLRCEAVPRTLKSKLRVHVKEEALKEGIPINEEAEKLFQDLDSDHDGKISYKELQEYLSSHGLVEASNQVSAEFFHELDPEDKGIIALQTWTSEFGGPMSPEQVVRYAARGVQAFLAKGRLLAYTSDVGESFRPVMPLWFVNGCYGLTFLYVAVGIGYETGNEYLKGSPSDIVWRSFWQASAFQSLASVIVPAAIIHKVVHTVQGQLHRLPPHPYVRWVPTAVALCCIPFLPLVDEPVEHFLHEAFSAAWPLPDEPKKELDERGHCVGLA